MNPKVIVIDGKTYHSVNEMPPEIRHKYEQAMRSLGDGNHNQVPDVFETGDVFADKDGDGVPDLLENIASSHGTVNTMKIVVDGKEFDGLEHLPPEARARFQEAMGALDANRNGIPDFVEGMMQANSHNVMSASAAPLEPPRRSAPLSGSPAIAPETSNGFMLVLAGLFLFLLCSAGAGAVWYFFLR